MDAHNPPEQCIDPFLITGISMSGTGRRKVLLKVIILVWPSYSSPSLASCAITVSLFSCPHLAPFLASLCLQADIAFVSSTLYYVWPCPEL